MPFSGFDPDGLALEEFKKANIDTVVIIFDVDCKINQLLDKYTQTGIRSMFLPTYPDIPKEKSLKRVIKVIINLAKDGENVGVHCLAGIGRTGLVMACLAIEILEITGDQAIEFVRKYIPGALETSGQVELARSYKIENRAL